MPSLFPVFIQIVSTLKGVLFYPMCSSTALPFFFLGVVGLLLAGISPRVGPSEKKNSISTMLPISISIISFVLALCAFMSGKD